MNNKSSSYPWLEHARSKRSSRTFDLGKQAIDKLISNSERVTYSSIANKSREIDHLGKGIHANAIRTNSDLNEYYKANSSTYKKNVAILKRKAVITRPEQDYRNIKLDRDLINVRKRYSKLSKQELIEQLINAEQYIATEFNKWLSAQFSQFPGSN